MRSWRSARPSPQSCCSISRAPPRPSTTGCRRRSTQEFGKLDGLVHAAALLGDRTPLEQYDVPTWCRVLHVNLTAPFILTQVLLPNLRKSPDASVIFVSCERRAQAARLLGRLRRVRRPDSSRCASMLALELEGEPNIRVNSINPGPHAHRHARRRLSGRGSEHAADARRR